MDTYRHAHPPKENKVRETLLAEPDSIVAGALQRMQQLCAINETMMAARSFRPFTGRVSVGLKYPKARNYDTQTFVS